MDEKVLFVDDDMNLADTSKEILSANGFSTDTAYTGKEALEKINKYDYDLVILDIKLPELSGFDILKTIRGSNNKVRVVLITGHAEFENAIDSLDLEVSEILMKPIHSSELIRVCKEYTR
jgi:DNA-binding response OmpR family regulator